ncbi:hypothetical protein DYB26_015387, partial [Aphanomyces astaci]
MMHRFRSAGVKAKAVMPWTGMVALGCATTATAAYSTPALAKAAPPLTAIDRSTPEVTLYQYEPCPYCCKTKAVLDFLKVPYNVVEVNPVTKKELKAITDYNKVPVAVVDGQVRGTRLLACPHPRHTIPIKVVLMPPNIYRTVPEALQAFQYCLTEGNFTAWERRVSLYTGAAAMYVISKRLKKKYGFDDERLALYEVTNGW